MTKTIETLVDNAYDEEHIALFKGSHYVECDPRTWPFYVIVMPTSNGKGPVSDQECDDIGWEVWDQFFNSYGSFGCLCDAIKLAMEMNKELLRLKK